MLEDRKMRFFLYSLYSYMENLFFIVLNLLPRMIRDFFFRMIFKKYGKNNMIDYGVYFRYPWKITIGNNVSINRGGKFFPSFNIKDSEIILGNHIAIGPGVSFFSASHETKGKGLEDTASTIKVSDYVWIGGNSLILSGVEICEGAIIAAGSVVVKKVDPYTIVAGNPAKEIRKRKMEANER